jgi:hypothetical protein
VGDDLKSDSGTTMPAPQPNPPFVKLLGHFHLSGTMCGRFTYKLTWADKLYRLTHQPPRNTQPRYNICPTTTIDTIVPSEGKRELVAMRWGLIPDWWNEPLKEMRLATSNARAETVATKPMFRDAFKNKRCLIPATGYYEWHDAAASSPTVSRGATVSRLHSLAYDRIGRTRTPASIFRRGLW